MIWNVVLLVILVICLIVEVRRIIQQKFKRDLIVFIAVWGLAVLCLAAHMLELPGFKPLDWIAAVTQPINKLMP